MYGTLPFQGAYGSNAIGYTPGLGGSKSVLPAGATLEHYYPFRNDLNDRQTAASGTLTRASTVIYQDKTGDWVSVADDVPALTGESVLLQGNISNVTEWPLAPTAGDETALTTYNAAYFDTPTLGNDSAGIGAAGFQSLLDAGIINGNYCRITMTDTSSSYREFTFTGSQGNTNNCSLMALVRLVSVVDSNKPPQIKPIGGATLDFANTDWQVVRLENAARAGSAATDVFRIRCTEGVYDIALITTVEDTIIQTFIEGSGTQAVSDLQLDSSTWHVNDCWYYGKLLYSGRAVNFPRFFESEVDGNNRFQFNYSSTIDELRLNIKRGGSTDTTSVSGITLVGGEDIEYLITQSPTEGTGLTVLIDGVEYSDTSANMADIPISNTIYLATDTAVVNNMICDHGAFKNGTGSVTLEQARIATR